GAAVSGALAAGGAVGAAVVTLGIGAAVSGALAAGGAVGAAVVTPGVRAAVGGPFATAAGGRDVVVVDRHENHLLHRAASALTRETCFNAATRGLPPKALDKRTALTSARRCRVSREPARIRTRCPTRCGGAAGTDRSTTAAGSPGRLERSSTRAARFRRSCRECPRRG